MDSLVEFPLLLPKHRDLLTNPLHQTHPLLEQGSLQLAACRISRDSTLKQEFLKRLQTFCWPDGARQQTLHTSQAGQDGLAGVVNGKWIPFHVTSNPF